MSCFSGMNAKRDIVKQRRLPTKAEASRGFAGKISCQMRHQCGLQWAMHHETTIAFNVTGIGRIVMDAVSVKGDRRKAKQNCGRWGEILMLSLIHI